MKPDQILKKFSPEFRMTLREGEFIATFDTAFESDVDRTTKMVRIPDSRWSSNFRITVTGFTDGDCQTVGDAREYHGDISLIQVIGEGASQLERRYLLAAPRIRLPAVKRGEYLPADAVLAQVRNAVSEAFSQALKQLYGMAPAADVSKAARPSAEGFFSRLMGRKWLLALVAAPAVVLVLLAVASRFVHPSTLPGYDSAAINHAMAQAPDVTAQVEQTREILKQMNLDPGNPGDMGCLAR